MEKFKTPEAVASIVYFLREADIPRSANRALIDDLFNGVPPFTEQEADENSVNTNVNFLDAPRVAHDARNTFNNAFLKPGNFFTATLDSGPVYKKDTWSRVITKNLTRIMKRSKPYMETLRSEFAQTVLHGVGPSLWEKKLSWCPSSIAIRDLLLPSRTLVSLDNLDFFSVYRQYTPSQLHKMTNGSKMDPGWNKGLVNKLLEKSKAEMLSNAGSNTFLNPERLAEAIKSDVAVFDNEYIPTIDCFDFYYKDEDKDGDEKWNRKIILDSSTDKESTDKFLFEAKQPIADNLSQFLHIMFADGANVAPFRYHAVRGLGWLLYAVCDLQNRLKCKFSDATFEQMLWYFQVNNPEDRERLEKVDLQHLGIIPEGLNFVKAQDRYQFNPGVIQAAFAMNRQSMAESSAQFRQDINDGTQKEMTAAEAMARVQSANALVGSMLNLAYTYQTFQYEEICRRFSLKNSIDKDVQEFQEACKKDGVPEEYLDSKRWNIEPERVLGAGNKTLEIAQADRLMAARSLYDPEPQREILHIFTEAMTDDPQMAERLVPISKKKVSDSIHDAQLVAGTLMQGLPVAIKTGMNHIEYIEALLVSMGAVIKRIQSGDNVGTRQEVEGLFNVAQHMAEHLSILAQDKSQKERVKKYGDTLGKFMNLVKGFSQRIQEQSGQQGPELTPEAQAKIQSALILAQTQARIKEESAAQRRQQKDADFQARQARDAQAHSVALGKQLQETKIAAAAKDLETAAEIRRKAMEQSSTPTQSTE